MSVVWSVELKEEVIAPPQDDMPEAVRAPAILPDSSQGSRSGSRLRCYPPIESEQSVIGLTAKCTSSTAIPVNTPLEIVVANKLEAVVDLRFLHEGYPSVFTLKAPVLIAKSDLVEVRCAMPCVVHLSSVQTRDVR